MASTRQIIRDHSKLEGKRTNSYWTTAVCQALHLAFLYLIPYLIPTKIQGGIYLKSQTESQIG